MLTETSGFCLKQVRVLSDVSDLAFDSYFIDEKAVIAKPLMSNVSSLSWRGCLYLAYHHTSRLQSGNQILPIHYLVSYNLIIGHLSCRSFSLYVLIRSVCRSRECALCAAVEQSFSNGTGFTPQRTSTCCLQTGSQERRPKALLANKWSM